MILDALVAAFMATSVALNGGVFLRLGQLIAQHDGHEKRIEKLEARNG